VEIELTEGEQLVPMAPPSVEGPAGFADAFRHLYEDAYQHAFKMLGDRQEAEDVAQEACTRACLRWRTLQNPAGWVTRVATNLVFDRYRRRRAATKYAETTRSPDATDDDPHLDLIRVHC
jgi:DNA-directed RNA polymerase specialized sigma24 family protein